MSRRQCVSRVAMAYRSRYAAVDITGPELPYALMDSSLTSAGLRRVIVDPHSRVATVAGGATAKDVAAAAGAHGLVAALGNCGAVGAAGLTLGGGYGPLNGLYGLAADNLLGAEVVLADGGALQPVPMRSPSCSGQFGAAAATSASSPPCESSCMRRDTCSRGRSCIPGARPRRCCTATRRLRRPCLTNLDVLVSMTSGPDGQPAITLLPLWNGDKLQGERAINHLQALGKPLLAQFGPMTYGECSPRLTRGWRRRMAGIGRCGRAHCPRSRPAPSLQSTRRSPARRRPLGGHLAPLPRRGHAHCCGGDSFRLAPGTFHAGDHRRLGARRE